MPAKKKKRVLRRVRNVKELITEGRELNEHIKDLQERLKDIKDSLREHAKAVDKHFMKGHNRAVVTIEDVDVFEMDVRKYKRAVKIKDFLDTVKVNNTQARALLGDDRFERLANKSTREFNRVIFNDISEVE